MLQPTLFFGTEEESPHIGFETGIGLGVSVCKKQPICVAYLCTFPDFLERHLSADVTRYLLHLRGCSFAQSQQPPFYSSTGRNGVFLFANECPL